MEEQIVVGQIVKAQGLKGEVKVKPLTSDPARFKKLRAVNVDTALFRIASLRLAEPFVYLKLAGVDTREAAEALKDKFISIDRVHSNIGEGEYFIADLVGCSLLIDGQTAGTVSDVLQYGAADVFSVRLDNGKIMMFPFLNSLNLDIDTAAKEIRAKKQALDGVAVYED